MLVAPGVPHEALGASTVLFYHYIARFKREGFRILNLLLLQPDNSTEDGLREYQMKLAAPGVFDIVACRAPRVMRGGRMGFRLDFEPLREELRRAAKFGPDGVVCFDLLCAWVGSALEDGTKVAWLGDLNFETEWYHAVYAARERWQRVWRLPRVWLRCRSWRRVYRRVLQRMSSVVVSSHASVQRLARLGIAATYQPYPWPSRPGDGGMRRVKEPGIPTFVFFGTLSGLGSRAAFHFLLRKVYPRLVGVWGSQGFRITVCGSRTLPGWVGEFLKGKPELEYLGFVEDLDPVLEACHAVLVPIDVPVGNRSRIVTAMARRSVVIAHRNASLGNPDLVDGVTCYLAGDSEEFVRKMLRAVEQRDEVARISERALECYSRRFAPEVAAAGLVEEVERAIAARTATRAMRPARSAG